MNRLFKRRIFRYIKSLGLYYGLLIFFKLRKKSTGPLINFRLPGLKHPVFIRKGTSDFAAFEEVFIDQQYKTDFAGPSVKTIIDAGANIGLSALYFLKRYPLAKIICLEPEDLNFEMLRKNLSGYPDIILLKNGLWHSKKNLQIINTAADSWAFEIKESSDGWGNIAGICVDDIIRDYHITSVDLLKIDIEGSEKEVFENNTLWIDKIKHLIIEVHEDMRPGAYEMVKKVTSSAGFDCVKQSSQYFFSKHNEQGG